MDLGGGVHLDLTLIPAGTFIMGDAHGCGDEVPLSKVKIDKPFWMGRARSPTPSLPASMPRTTALTSAYYNKDQNSRGLPVNRAGAAGGPRFVAAGHGLLPLAFAEDGPASVTCPAKPNGNTPAAPARDTPLYFGDCTTDFGKLANLADRQLLGLCRRDSPKWIPAVATVNDGAMVTDNVGQYAANAWGLYDMAGNAAEWTRSAYRPYPYQADGRDDPAAGGTKVVRGGSFYDRPAHARSGFRLHYQAWQQVFDVGFRVVMETREAGVETADLFPAEK